MIKAIKDKGLEIKLWADDIEPGAMKQIENMALHPFARKHVAVMPDCHEGFGMPIGGVLATSGVIIPNAVGVDIGCGMSAVRTSLDSVSSNDLKKVMSAVREAVPLGFRHHGKPQDATTMPQAGELGFDPLSLPVVSREYASATHQVGTLGGGNHFIELQKGDDRHIWVMIHSGSRNIGKQVADYYNRIAVSLNKDEKDLFGPATGLAWLRTDSDAGRKYIMEMEYCVAFARSNRYLMMTRILSILGDIFGSRFSSGEIINIAHNYASFEEHFGEKLIVHRKGATKASEGITGIIPGSQGTRSFIVRGLGNPDSFESCSHGAGRRMGRNEAVRKLDLEAEKRKLDNTGVIHSLRSRSDLEEAPSAYKNIEDVMAKQSDLAEVLVALEPLAVIKG